MYLCYLDESGTPEIGAQTSHFVLVGLAIPAASWQANDRQIDAIKDRHGLKEAEIHTGYMARRYPEQDRVPGFAALSRDDRRLATSREREKELIRTAALKRGDRLKALKTLYRKNADYQHLTLSERQSALRELAGEIGAWTDARLFCVAMDKRTLTTRPAAEEVFRTAFGRLRVLFQNFLVAVESAAPGKGMGMLIEDNNETVAKKITSFMRRLHESGDTSVERGMLIETPLFVDSSLTSMVQMADLCAYAIRRSFENGEVELFNSIAPRFAGSHDPFLGLEHVVLHSTCGCRVCSVKRGVRQSPSS